MQPDYSKFDPVCKLTVCLRSSRIISGTGCITAKGCGTLSWFSLKAFSKREKVPGANPRHLNCQSGKGAYYSGSALDNRHINGHNITNWQQIPLSDAIALEVRAPSIEGGVVKCPFCNGQKPKFSYYGYYAEESNDEGKSTGFRKGTT